MKRSVLQKMPGSALDCHDLSVIDSADHSLVLRAKKPDSGSDVAIL
jgi:hypothetical protein